MKKTILLTFTGFHDPFSRGLVGEEDVPGPILSLIKEKDFAHVFLFETPSTKEISQETREAIIQIRPNIQIEIIGLNIMDPTDYREILSNLVPKVKKVTDENLGADLFIATASGTPQMHACWLLLAASGELPARILHIRPPRFVTANKPLISEVELTAGHFPVIRFYQESCAQEINQEPSMEKVRAYLGIIGNHELLVKTLDKASMLAKSQAPVLIMGETGTGKELFAKFIHHMSERPQNSFFPVNCSAIPHELVESVLFGHKKGAFTGAWEKQIGKFESADGGTLFLDELGELPLAAQAKLLRVLQDGIVEPLGQMKGKKVNVRVVAATNKDIRKMVRQGTFREDLFYRLNVGEIVLPSLRDRRSDIPKIALHVLDRINGTSRIFKRLSARALSRLQAHDWPGNVRDLANAIERSVLLTKKDVLDADDLLIGEPVGYADSLEALPEPVEGFSLEEYLGSARKQLLLRALALSEGNQTKAAKRLGISSQAVSRFLKDEK